MHSLYFTESTRDNKCLSYEVYDNEYNNIVVIEKCVSKVEVRINGLSLSLVINESEILSRIYFVFVENCLRADFSPSSAYRRRFFPSAGHTKSWSTSVAPNR